MVQKPDVDPGLRERNKSEKKARIRDAAAALFREHGFDATTTHAVAERAGVAKGTVFLYASTKSELVALVFEERIRRTAEQALARARGAATLADELDAVFARFFAMYAKDAELARIFVKELAFAGGVARAVREEVDRAFLTALAERIEARKGRGEVAADVPSPLAAASVFALYLMALMGWLSGALPSATAARAHLRASIELMIRGLAPAAVRVGDDDEGGESWRAAHRSTKERSGSARRGPATSKRGASATAATKRAGSS